MTWKSHRITTFAVVTALTGNLFAGVISSYASHLPDKIEFSLLRSPVLRGKYHRTYTHWLLAYLIIAVVLFSYMAANNIQFLGFVTISSMTVENLLINLLLYVTLGCIMHILEDAPCGKVPVFFPKSKLTICPRLFKVGTISEYIFTTVICVVSLLIILDKFQLL